MTVDWSSDDRYRYTLTLTPMTEDDMQAVLDDIRTRFGRAPLVHVIDKRDSHSHLDEVRPQAEGAGETEVRRVLADRGYRGDVEPVHVLLGRVLDQLGARSTDPYGTGGSYPEPHHHEDTPS